MCKCKNRITLKMQQLCIACYRMACVCKRCLYPIKMNLIFIGRTLGAVNKTDTHIITPFFPILYISIKNNTFLHYIRHKLFKNKQKHLPTSEANDVNIPISSEILLFFLIIICLLPAVSFSWVVTVS